MTNAQARMNDEIRMTKSFRNIHASVINIQLYAFCYELARTTRLSVWEAGTRLRCATPWQARPAEIGEAGLAFQIFCSFTDKLACSGSLAEIYRSTLSSFVLRH